MDHKFKVGDRVLAIKHPLMGTQVGVVRRIPDRISPFYVIWPTDQCGYYNFETDLVLVPTDATDEQVQALVGICEA